MFGLPAFTVLVIGGIAVLWLMYTAVFMLRSKDWDKEDER